MGENLQNQKNTDCSFAFLDEDGNQRQDEQFSAHTCILSTGSDVFEKMFFGELKEKSPVVIRDIKPQIFKKLIG